MELLRQGLYGKHLYKACADDNHVWWKVSESQWAETAWDGSHQVWGGYFVKDGTEPSTGNYVLD